MMTVRHDVQVPAVPLSVTVTLRAPLTRNPSMKPASKRKSARAMAQKPRITVAS